MNIPVKPLESAVLFTPGRSSYLDEYDVLQLSDGSIHRAQVAAEAYLSGFHETAVFAGGFPGLAQGWDAALTPPTDRREAHLMAIPLQQRLAAEGKSAQEIADIVGVQGDSSSSFGDVIISVERGLLDPNRFNTDARHGINLVTGAFHGKRFRLILAKALDMDPKRIDRLAMRDVYGVPAHPRQPAESASKAFITELAAIAVTEVVLRNIKPGDLNGLKDAEQRFAQLATRYTQS